MSLRRFLLSIALPIAVAGGAAGSTPFVREYVIPAERLAGGEPARVTLVQRADAFDMPVRWTLTVTVKTKQVFVYEADEAWMEPLYREPGFMAGWSCKGYSACKTAWLDSVRRVAVHEVDARLGHREHFMLEQGDAHEAAATAERFLQEELHVDAEARTAALKYIATTLGSGPVQVISVGGTPNTDGMWFMYVPALERMVRVFSP